MLHQQILFPSLLLVAVDVPSLSSRLRIDRAFASEV
jgi:hypothetical protein